jgi:hypothetical protein
MKWFLSATCLLVANIDTTHVNERAVLSMEVVWVHLYVLQTEQQQAYYLPTYLGINNS